MKERQDFFIEFQPLGRRGYCPEGTTILAAAKRLGVDLVRLCGGRGICGACKVRLIEGPEYPPGEAEKRVFSTEELKDGWRLACKTELTGNCKIYTPPESLYTTQRLQLVTEETLFPIDFAVQTIDCQLEEPTLAEPTPDAENLYKALDPDGDFFADTCVLREIPEVLRSKAWRVNVALRGREIIGVRKCASQALALAVDLGSTKIAGYLVDTSSGKVLDAQGMANPQISHGEDIITRMDLAMKSPEGARLLRDLVRDGIQNLAVKLCKTVDADTEDILETVIVGNTAMHHLLLDLPVRQLAIVPFIPATGKSLLIKARNLDLRFAPGSYVYIPPLIAGFVGCDHTAALTAVTMESRGDRILMVDIGTNTELSLISPEGIVSASCASGPTFEGYHIKHGVRATTGAIERISLDGKRAICKTIDDKPAIGICGSGILDAVAELFTAGILDPSGRMVQNSHSSVTDDSGSREFILVLPEESAGGRQITINQGDIRQVQSGKAAIQAAIQVLLERLHLSPDDLDSLIIAGAFGTYLDIKKAMDIGMIPTMPLSKVHQIGNAAGTGARILLLSEQERRRLEDLTPRIQYVELAGTGEFSDAFIQACALGPFGQESIYAGR